MDADLHGSAEQRGAADLPLVVCYKLPVAWRATSEGQRLHFAPLFVTFSCQAAQRQHASPACKMQSHTPCYFRCFAAEWSLLPQRLRLPLPTCLHSLGMYLRKTVDHASAELVNICMTSGVSGCEQGMMQRPRAGMSMVQGETCTMPQHVVLLQAQRLLHSCQLLHKHVY